MLGAECLLCVGEITMVGFLSTPSSPIVKLHAPLLVISMTDKKKVLRWKRTVIHNIVIKPYSLYFQVSNESLQVHGQYTNKVALKRL